MRKRNFLLRKAKKSKHRVDFTKYKRMRNKVINHLRTAKQRHFSSLLTTDTKTFWKTVKSINKQQVTIPALKQDSVHAVTDTEKSNMLNNYFSKCWNSKEPPLTESLDIYPTNQHEDCPDDYLCTPEEVAAMIAGLDVSKASGLDGISGRMLKSTAPSIAPSLAKLFNLSISNGRFPKVWKEARIVPIPKSSTNKNSPSGYRPISLLSIVSKLLERHYHALICEHLNAHQPISESQWGFQKKKSTISALLCATHDWQSQLDRNRETCCIFFDFQKAFDTVPHKRLMQKLEDINIHPILTSWIHSYLALRKQSVVVNGVSSMQSMVTSGVPQGSVLGPLLFLICINDLTNLHLSDGANLSLYADDILLYKVIYTDSDYVHLQQDIDNIFEWTLTNLMTFNSAKCKCLLISRKRNSSSPIMTLNNNAMELVRQYKYLGVIISSDLSWSHHIQALCSKTRKLLGLLYRRFSSYSNAEVMLKLYLTIVRPHLDYAAQVWHPYQAKNITALENVQKFALRICSRSYDTNYQDLLDCYHLYRL